MSGEVEQEKNNTVPLTLDTLPSGYRFNPSDTEIIVDYLRKKVDHQSLPMDKIIEVNLYDHDPDLLAEMYKPLGREEWFYFTPRDRKYPNGQRPNRSVGGGSDNNNNKDDEQKVGYWKATGSDKQVKHEDQKVGYRKALVFYRGSARDAVKTNWIMHEFRVADPPKPPPSRTTRNTASNMRLDDCVLCRVYKKEERACKRSQEEEAEIDESNPNDDFTIMEEDSVEETQNNSQYDQFMDNRCHQALQNQQLSNQMGQHPINQMGQRPISQMGQQPFTMIGHLPIAQMGQQHVAQRWPISQMEHQSVAQMHQVMAQRGHQLVAQMDHQTISHMDHQPIAQRGHQPIAQMDHQPIISHMGRQPIISRMDHQPIAQMDQQLISQMDHQMGHQTISQMGQNSSANVVSSQDNLPNQAPTAEYNVMQSTESLFPNPYQIWDMHGYNCGFDYRFSSDDPTQ